MAVWQMQEQNESCCSFNQPSNSTGTTGADDEITFSVTRNCSVFHLDGALADHHHVYHRPRMLGLSLGSTFGSS
jgi:hypothetical protein